MENPQETEIIKRWQAAEQDITTSSTAAATTGGSRKRPRRAIDNGNTLPIMEELIGPSASTAATRKTATAGRKKKDTRTNRVAEVTEVEEEDVEEAGLGMMGFFTRRSSGHVHETANNCGLQSQIRK